MQFQIRSVILWPRRASHPPRELTFLPGRLNVISGVSKKGKSALLSIVDYCIGAGSCTIPVNLIRDACSWFGVIVDVGRAQLLLARKEPGAHRSTNEMFMLEGREVVVPVDTPTSNASVEDVKHRLNELARLPALAFDPGDEHGFRARPSFRDMVAFNFQPQNVIANPNVMFYRSDTFEHREKLRTILPFVLDAISADELLLRYRADMLRKQRARKNKELMAIKEVSQRWVAELRSWLNDARELGLIESIPPRDAKTEDLIAVLQVVVERPLPEILGVSLKTISETVQTLVDLQRRESDASRHLAALRGRLAEMSKLRSSTNSYFGAIRMQRERMSLSAWLLQRAGAVQPCPLCDHPLEAPARQLRGLVEALENLEGGSDEEAPVAAAFDREVHQLEVETTAASETLEALQQERHALELNSEEARAAHYALMSAARFIGRTEQGLHTHALFSGDSALRAEIDRLDNELGSLEERLDRDEVRRRQSRAVAIVNNVMRGIVPTLDAEMPEEQPASFVVSELTVSVSSALRESFLWEVGSAANWLSYHVALLLGFHFYFRSQKQSPVPNFLMIDQPSQAYFPRGITSETSLGGDPDIAAVRRIYHALGSAVRDAAGQLQVIVVDHAPEAVWRDAPAVHRVEDWGNQNALVPTEWLTDD